MNDIIKGPFTLAHWAVLIALLLFVGGIIDTAGCNPDTTAQDSGQNSGSKLMSKAEWMQKVRPYYNHGGRQVTTIANFKALFGEPSQTQTDGDTGHTYWSYECSDGTIQIDLVDPNMSRGTMLINSISDY